MVAVADDLIEFVSRASDWKLALIVFGLVLAESLFVTDLVAPGEVGLVVAGAAAERNGTSLIVVAAAASFGAIAGDSLGYVFGRFVGADLIEQRHWLRWLRPGLRRARRRFDRHGVSIVAVARWIGALRALVPVVAGSARLSASRFLLADVPSAVAWSVTIASIGFVWGDDIAGVIDRVGIGVSVAAVAALVLIFVVRRRRRRLGAPNLSGLS
jgi:membrane protein DedA with SNARE-associated domain